MRLRFPQPKSAWADLGLRLLLSPLYAIPFALFFGTLFGRGAFSYVSAYWISIVFAVCINLAMWIVERAILPRIPAAQWEPGTGKKGAFWIQAVLFAGTSIVGSMVGALIIHLTILPGFLGSPRQVLINFMFALLFTVLVSGVIYAVVFYRHALQRARAEQELNLARRIQRSFLITDFPELPGFDVHAVNVSSRQVSGDFYDVVQADNGEFLIAIADVAGKGVPAALLTSMLQASLRTQAQDGNSVAAMLARLNALIYRSSQVHQFATCFIARIDARRRTLAYANAGHNPPVLLPRAGGRRTLERGGTVVGILEGIGFEEESVALTPGDRLILYTDGITEAPNAAGELYGEERLFTLLDSIPHDVDAHGINDRILQDVRAFSGDGDPADDMTLVVVRVLDGAPARA